jgi:hypothetical protein
LPLNWYQLLLDFVAMGKTSRRKQTNSGDTILDESSSTAHDDSIRASLDSNTTGSVPNATTDDVGETQEKVPESKVWKFATKVGSEKAKCNLCQVGKIVVVTPHLKGHSQRLNLVLRRGYSSMAWIRNQVDNWAESKQSFKFSIVDKEAHA